MHSIFGWRGGGRVGEEWHKSREVKWEGVVCFGFQWKGRGAGSGGDRGAGLDGIGEDWKVRGRWRGGREWEGELGGRVGR